MIILMMRCERGDFRGKCKKMVAHYDINKISSFWNKNEYNIFLEKMTK
jgi:hypothetical protein